VTKFHTRTEPQVKMLLCIHIWVWCHCSNNNRNQSDDGSNLFSNGSAVLCWALAAFSSLLPYKPITVAARSRVLNVFACSNAEIVSSNPTRGMDVCVRLFSLYCPACRLRPYVRLIPRPRSPTDWLMIKKLEWNEAFHGCPVLQVGATGIGR
jgi:hypothetical protein